MLLISLDPELSYPSEGYLYFICMSVKSVTQVRSKAPTQTYYGIMYLSLSCLFFIYHEMNFLVIGGVLRPSVNNDSL